MGPAVIADADLRELLEANLRALHAILGEQQRAVDASLRAVAALRDDLKALASPGAPWVQAMHETRALLFVALREHVVHADRVGDDAAATRALPRQPSSAEATTRV